MKSVVVFVLTFALATAAATGAKVMLTKPGSAVKLAAPTDSTHADSLKKPDSTRTDTAIVASGQQPPAPADTLRVPAATRAPVTDSAKAKQAAAPAAPTPSVPAPTAAPVSAAPDTNVQASERRIAKVFTSMDAKQAAKVLEHMSDGDVQIILGYVGVKQAAQILTELPPERVANLSKLSMQPGGKR